MNPDLTWARLAAWALLIAALSSHAQTPGPEAPAAAASAPAVRPTSATPPVAAPLPFAAVTRDAKRIDGLFTLWQKDDKVWIELKPSDFGKPFLLSPKISRGIGEAGLFAGTMLSRGLFGRTQTIEFKRLHNQVQMLAINNAFVAAAKTPTGAAVNIGFSPSLLGSAAVASQPHPERKSVLVELNSLFLTDLQAMAMRLNRVYRQTYFFDVRNSTIASVRGKPEMVAIETMNHYGTPNIQQALPMPPGATPIPVPQPTTPSSLPDVRSLFIGLHYSLSALPAVPMTPRRADARIGHFTTNVSDFSNDLSRTPRQRFVNRWRLEKKDPAAELSEPVKPITFWLDRTVPLEYRQALTEGILEWNRAFERIGFKNAVVVRQQADDADFDTLDTGVASVRWMTNSQPQFGAIGPSDVDPRTGEILDADISFESLSSRNHRSTRAQVLGIGAADWARRLQASDAIAEGLVPSVAAAGGHRHGAECDYAEHAAEQLGYAMDVLGARGDVAPDGPEVRRFVQDYLRGVATHEVGHTLGLRHNFRSSRAYTLAQLADRTFTDANGIAGSIMEYPAVNLPPPGVPYERHGNPFRGGIGPYDFWAIEYAYRPLASDTEAAELQRIAGRSGERELAYGTDEDNGLGLDPETLQFDLGDDPVAFARQRLAIGHDLLARAERRQLGADQDFFVLRRMVSYAVGDIGRSAGVLARQIGGLRTLRDFANTGRDPLQPVDAAVQRAALDTLASGVLAADAFKLSATLRRRLVADFQERGDALFSGETPVQTDYNVDTVVQEMRRSLLAQLMSDGVAGRIIDSRGKLARPAEAFSLAELYGRLSKTIWSELGGSRGTAPSDIDAGRRELQREHVNRITGALLRPAPTSRADARSLLRSEAQSLLVQINAALKGARGALSAEARAHLADSAESLTQALQARTLRTGA